MSSSYIATSPVQNQALTLRASDAKFILVLIMSSRSSMSIDCAVSCSTFCTSFRIVSICCWSSNISCRRASTSRTILNKESNESQQRLFKTFIWRRQLCEIYCLHEPWKTIQCLLTRIINNAVYLLNNHLQLHN